MGQFWNFLAFNWSLQSLGGVMWFHICRFSFPFLSETEDGFQSKLSTLCTPLLACKHSRRTKEGCCVRALEEGQCFFLFTADLTHCVHPPQLWDCEISPDLLSPVNTFISSLGCCLGHWSLCIFNTTSDNVLLLRVKRKLNHTVSMCIAFKYQGCYSWSIDHFTQY